MEVDSFSQLHLTIPHFYILTTHNHLALPIYIRPRLSLTLQSSHLTSTPENNSQNFLSSIRQNGFIHSLQGLQGG